MVQTSTVHPLVNSDPNFLICLNNFRKMLLSSIFTNFVRSLIVKNYLFLYLYDLVCLSLCYVFIYQCCNSYSDVVTCWMSYLKYFCIVGVEPWHFYFANAFLSFNAAFILALISLPFVVSRVARALMLVNLPFVVSSVAMKSILVRLPFVASRIVMVAILVSLQFIVVGLLGHRYLSACYFSWVKLLGHRYLSAYCSLWVRLLGLVTCQLAIHFEYSC